ALLVCGRHLEQRGRHRPGLVLRPLAGRTDADGQVRDRQRVLPVRRSDAVRTRVPSSQNHDVLAFRRDLVDHGVASADAVLLGEVLHGEMHTGKVAARDREVARLEGAGRDDDGVVACTQFAPADVHADVHASPEAGALGLHLPQPVLDGLLLELEVRDAVAEKTTDAIIALENGNGVAGASELLSGGESGGAGADDGNGLAGQALRRVWLHPVVRPGLVDDRLLDELDRHGLLIDPQNTGGLARGRAQPAGELWEIVGGVQSLARLAHLTA